LLSLISILLNKKSTRFLFRKTYFGVYFYTFT